ncbi:MAG: DNA polymerase III subunit delta [Polyangia bacterium]
MARPDSNADPLAPLRGNDLGSLYFIYGKERFLVDRAVELVKGKVLQPATRDFNYDSFQGKESDAQKIAQAARTLPMMAKRRLVLVRDADEMKAAELAALIPYLEKPCAESCLVFVGEKVDQRLKFFTAFKKRGVFIKLEPLYPRQLPAFAREEAQARGVRFEAGVAELVCDEVGEGLGQLVDAIERLSVYVGERKAITVADVEEVVATTRQKSVFELANAIGERHRERALIALASLIGARESGVRIVAMLARHVRQLWTAQELIAKRLNKFDLAQALGIPPFFVDDIERQARRLDRATLEPMHEALYQADRALKSSRLDDERILERLILRLTIGPTASDKRARG